MDGFLFALTLVTALGCGLVAGFFFTFSASVMKALAQLPPAQGVAAMNSINVAVPASFATMLAIIGAGLLCLALVGWGLADLDEPYAGYLLGGSVLYLAGVIVMTIAFHIPRNNALATVEPTSPEAAGHWSRYVSSWTAGNHVRTITALAAAALFTVALTV